MTHYESSFLSLSMVTQVSNETYRLPLATVYLPVTSAEQTAATNRASPPFPRDLETWKPQVERILSYVFCTPAGHPSSGEFLGLRRPKHARSFNCVEVQSINLPKNQAETRHNIPNFKIVMKRNGKIKSFDVKK